MNPFSKEVVIFTIKAIKDLYKKGDNQGAKKLQEILNNSINKKGE